MREAIFTSFTQKSLYRLLDFHESRVTEETSFTRESLYRKEEEARHGGRARSGGSQRGAETVKLEHHTVVFEGFVWLDFRTLRDQICTTQGAQVDCAREVHFC